MIFLYFSRVEVPQSRLERLDTVPLRNVVYSIGQNVLDFLAFPVVVWNVLLVS